MYQMTTAVEKIAALQKRIRVIQGGTSAGKTVAILMLLIQIAQQKRKAISVTSESLPHLKRGAMREFFNILKTHQYYQEANHNKSDLVYNFPETGSYIEFFGADDPAKLRGPRRDILFMNEANNLSFETFEQLEPRTTNTILLDFNPVSEFWAHDEVVPHMESDFIVLTYKDNEGLAPSIVKTIESRKERNPNWWRIYGEGQIGEKEGQVYDNWKPIDSIPDEARLERRGMDFGYTNDPSTIVDVYKWNDAIVLDERLYRSGMKNPELAGFLKGLEEPQTLVVADSAEPKSIDEIKGRGIRIVGAVKGQGSVNFGIDTVQDQTIYVTKRSVNIWKEQRNYLWKIDRDGNLLNVPEEGFDHTMDALRYAISDLVGGKSGHRHNKARIGL